MYVLQTFPPHSLPCSIFIRWVTYAKSLFLFSTLPPFGMSSTLKKLKNDSWQPPCSRIFSGPEPVEIWIQIPFMYSYRDDVNLVIWKYETRCQYQGECTEKVVWTTTSFTQNAMVDEPYVGPCYGRTEGIAHHQSFTQVQGLVNT